MTAHQPQRAPNTTGSVSTDTANSPDPHRATQGETLAAELDALAKQMRARGDYRDEVQGEDGEPCDGECEEIGSDCHTVSAVATWTRAGLMLARRAAELRATLDIDMNTDTEQWTPSHEAVVVGD